MKEGIHSIPDYFLDAAFSSRARISLVLAAEA
jgi:hypothetical protein